LSTKRRFVQKTAIDGVVLEEMLVTVAARFDERGVVATAAQKIA
jgi:hypothetical protein